MLGAGYLGGDARLKAPALAVAHRLGSLQPVSEAEPTHRRPDNVAGHGVGQSRAPQAERLTSGLVACI